MRASIAPPLVATTAVPIEKILLGVRSKFDRRVMPEARIDHSFRTMSLGKAWSHLFRDSATQGFILNIDLAKTTMRLQTTPA